MSYIIENYKEEYFEQVAKLLVHLWGRSLDLNKNKLQDKYKANPFQGKIIGTIAIFNNKIVGFRGFIVTKWVINGKVHKFLSASDACVHPDHRRNGLFRKMTIEALKSLENEDYSGYINLSSNKFSTPGYLKMGWIPLELKSYIRSIAIKRFVPFIKKLDSNNKIIKSKNIYFKEIIELNHSPSKNIYFNMTHEYYQYKLNRLNSFTFYYLYEAGILVSFALIIKNRFRANIIDFGFRTNKDFHDLYRRIGNEYLLISIWDISVMDILKDNIICKLFKLIEKKKRLPFLIRPMKYEYEDSDFYIDNIDMRVVKNWEIKGFYSD